MNSAARKFAEIEVVKLYNSQKQSEPFKATIEFVEKAILKEAYAHCGGCKVQIAKVTGLNRNTVLKKLRYYGLA